MKITVCYPPRAYPNIPYLAPFLLKGHVESATSHRVFADDLNIDYHLHIWSAPCAEALASELLEKGNKAEALAAELLAFHGAAAWRALRDTQTYADAATVWRHATVLRLADRVVQAADRSRGAAMPELPSALGEWSALVAGLRPAVVGAFIAAEVDAGRFDDADVIGLSVAYVPQLLPSLLLAAELKRRRPGVPIVLGGGGVTHFLAELVQDSSFWRDVDYLVPYEGEHSFVQLLESLETGSEPPANIAWQRDGHVVYKKSLGSRPRVQAIPDYSDLVHRYPTPLPIYSLLTSKGCYWGKCTFCTHHEGYGEGYFPFSDGTVQSSLRRLLDQGARHFYLVDEALPPRMLTELAQVFESAGAASGGDLGWMAEARMEKVLVNTPAAKLLRRSGCRLLVNGIESGCQVVVDAMKKGIDLALVERFARECQGEGIRTGWMFFIGYPGESLEQARETFAFIERNAAVVDFASVGVFALERGSPLWQQPGQAGITSIEDKERPYSSFYSFRDAGGLYDRAALARRLIGLHREFSQLRPLFEGVGDRAYALFLHPGSDTRDREVSGRFEWRSPRVGADVVLDVRGRRVEIGAP